MEYNSHRILTNTIWSVLSYAWPVLFSILITPIVVTSLGIRDFGVYTFINTVISLLGLLDLGISTAINKYLSEYHAQKDSKKIRDLVGTASIIFFGIAIVGFSVFFIGYLIPSFSTTFTEYSKYRVGIIFAGMTFVTMILTSVYNITFTALQRMDISSKFGIIILTLQQISVLVLVSTGFGINSIFVVQFAIGLTSYFTHRYFAQGILPELSQKILWNVIEAKKLYKFGLVTFINNTATVSLTYFDRIIIPFFLGPSGLTYYSLPGNISTKIPSLSNSLTVILFPMTSGLHGIGDTDKIRNLYIRSFRLITIISASVTITTIAYAYQIMKYWISVDFAEKTTSVLIILAITNFILALIGPLSSFLLGLGKLKFLTTLSILMALINILLLIILLPIFGINGAAWAYLLSLLPAVYMFYVTERHYLSLPNRRRYYLKLIVGNIFVSIIIYMIAKLLLVYFITNLLTLLLVVGITTLLYIALYWSLNLFEKEDIRSIELFVKRVTKII